METPLYSGIRGLGGPRWASLCGLCSVDTLDLTLWVLLCRYCGPYSLDSTLWSSLCRFCTVDLTGFHPVDLALWTSHAPDFGPFTLHPTIWEHFARWATSLLYRYRFFGAGCLIADSSVQTRRFLQTLRCRSSESSTGRHHPRGAFQSDECVRAYQRLTENPLASYQIARKFS